MSNQLAIEIEYTPDGTKVDAEKYRTDTIYSAYIKELEGRVNKNHRSYNYEANTPAEKLITSTPEFFTASW